MDDDLADVARVLQSNVIPGLAAVVRTIDAIAEGDVAANAGFAGANINYMGSELETDAAMEEVVCLSKRGSQETPPSVVSKRRRRRRQNSKCSAGLEHQYGKGPAATERADEAPFHSAVGL